MTGWYEKYKIDIIFECYRFNMKNMDIIGRNIQTLVLNETNRVIGESVYGDGTRKNVRDVCEYINTNSSYYIIASSSGLSMDDSLVDVGGRCGELKCVITDKPCIETVPNLKPTKKSKKTDIEKLMTKIMSLVSKHISNEQEVVMKKVNERFNIVKECGDDVTLPVKDDVVKASVEKIRSTCVVGASHTPTLQPPDINDVNITEALIKVAGGVPVENVIEIQRALEEVSVDDECIEIDVESIILNGKRFYIDNNTQELYDFESELNVGRYDVKSSRVIYY